MKHHERILLTFRRFLAAGLISYSPALVTLDAEVTGGSPETILSTPVLPIEETGVYKKVVSRLQTLFTEKKFFDIYKVAGNFLQENDASRQEDKRFYPKSQEEALALE